MFILPGKVYKGILSNGQHVAVKHIINDGEMETFVREVTSLSHIRHPNLVSLLGHCEGRNECFLVYELCENGTLSEWLFGMLMGVLDYSIVSSFSVPPGFIWDNGEQQVKRKSCLGAKDLRLQSIALGLCRFSTRIPKAALYIAISRHAL